MFSLLLPVSNAYDGPGAPVVKGVQLLNVFPEGDLALRAVEQNREDAGIVHHSLGVQCNVLLQEDSFAGAPKALETCAIFIQD